MSFDDQLITTSNMLTLYTHVYDKPSGLCISNPCKENNHLGYYFQQWDPITKWGVVNFPNGDGVKLNRTEEVATESIHFPNAKTVFKVSKDMANLVHDTQSKYRIDTNTVAGEIAVMLKFPDVELEIQKERGVITPS